VLSILTVFTVLVVPFVLEAMIRIGFKKQPVKRHALFYMLTPVVSILVYLTFAAVLGHPVIALVGWFFVYGGLTPVSNIKNSILGEPLVAPDLETTRHLLIYPEFYVDYVGRVRFVSILLGFAASIAASFIFETSFANHQPWLSPWVAGPLLAVLWIGFMILMAKGASRILTHRRAARLGITFDINADTARFGFFPLIALYAVLLLDKSQPVAPDNSRAPLVHEGDTQPDIIALQAESYFDIDRLYRKIDGFEDHSWDALAALRAKGAATGTLEVPAWGANTMKSEFAFLTGIANHTLGIDRINPYQRAAYTGVETIATRLKAQGYRTICVHPAKKEFFRRSTVIPLLGFDEFIGLEAFHEEQRFGPYIRDAALGDRIEEIIAAHKAASEQPLFIFTITIESHGPWDAGRLSAWLDEEALTEACPSGDRSFALYRKHMDNALALFDRLGPAATQGRERVLALYGDHQPALRELFDRHGPTDETVDYILWHSEKTAGEHGRLTVEALADRLLTLGGFRL
jgi:hypothetical protein